MLSFIARALFAATALSPMLVTYAFVYATSDPSMSGLLLLIAIGLVVICKLILNKARKDIPEEPLYISSVKIADQSNLTFIVAYLFPLVFSVSGEPAEFRLGVLALVFVLLLVAIYRSDAYSFNPLLGLVFGYHFFEITTTKDITFLLVSKREIVDTKVAIEGKPLSLYMYLDAGK